MKKFLIIIFGSILLVVFVLLLINFVGLVSYSKKNVSQAEISGIADSEFIAETFSNSKTIEFSFTPKEEVKKNYLLTYKLKKDGEVIDSKNKELVTGISRDNPIAFRVARDNESEYSLETVINDAVNSAIELHNDRIVIRPQGKEPLKNNQKIQDLFSDYIKENISTFSSDKAVLGGSFHVTKIRFLNANSAFVNYEDGHIALSALVNFYLNNDDEVGITSFEIKEDGISFSEIGNIVSSDSGWDIVYEKSGAPALREALIFTGESKCLDGDVDFICNSGYWKNGDRVKISGKLKYDGVEVAILMMVTENSQAASHTDDDVDNCQERGGIIMFPGCAGCEPYCSFEEGSVIRKTLDDSDDFCTDNCGNGICEKVVCLGEECPCAETPRNCPADCD